MQNEYKILGVSEHASNEEIESAYKALKEKYSRERFYEGEIGNEAAKNLTKLENAYAEIMSNRQGGNAENSYFTPAFDNVERLIKDKKIEDAQRELDDITERNAEWHYLQAVIFYKKNWSNESKKQLEIAMNMEPNNKKYSEAYTKLKQKNEFNEKQFQSGNAQQNAQRAQTERQMGGDDCGSFLDCCSTMLCLNCLCNGCS